MRILLAAVIALALFVPPYAAGEKSAGKFLFEAWDAAYLENGRAGYVHTYTEEIEHEGHKLLRTVIQFRLKVKRFEQAVDLGMDADGKGSLHGSETGDIDRQVLPACRRNAHRHRRAPPSAPAAGGFRPLLRIPVQTAARGGDEHDAEHQLAAPRPSQRSAIAVHVRFLPRRRRDLLVSSEGRCLKPLGVLRSFHLHNARFGPTHHANGS